MIRMKKEIKIPKEVMLIHAIFKLHGFDLFPIGGAVRDAVLNVTPKDWDLVTNATPDKVIELFKSESFVTNILETGKNFGVINLITVSDEFEIATMRVDVGSGRHPDSVEFTNIETDVLRRDLTCNGLFFDIDTSEVVDLVGGIEDLKNGIVRTIGNPNDRFAEDRLRILRIIRFIARFGAVLAEDADLALKADSSLTGVSPERIRDEFLKGLKTAKSPKHFLELLDKYNLFDSIFPDLNIDKDFTDEREPMVVIANLLGRDNSDLKLRLNALKFSTMEIKKIAFLVNLFKFGTGMVAQFKKLQIISQISDGEIRAFVKINGLDENLMEAFIKFELTVTGQDMIDKGIKIGPELGFAIMRAESEKFKELL